MSALRRSRRFASSMVAGSPVTSPEGRVRLWYRERAQEDSVQIGVDIGGTFTDIVALDRGGQLALTKVPSTPKDLLEGIGAAGSSGLDIAGAKAGAIERSRRS